AIQRRGGWPDRAGRLSGWSPARRAWIRCPCWQLSREHGMAKRVLLLGVRADLLEGVMRELRGEGVEFLDGTGVSDVEPAFRQADIDHVVIGGGPDPGGPPGISRPLFPSRPPAPAP